MSLDGFLLKALVSELNRDFSGTRVTKVYQPTPLTLTLLVGETRKKQRLVLSIDSSFPGLFVSTEPYENPQTPPHFCLMLRKFIEGSHLDSVSMAGFERVVFLTFLGRDDLGEPRTYILAVELTGRHSNVILTSNGVILDALKRIPWGPDVLRPILPGLRYEAPPAQGKIAPHELTTDVLYPACQNSEKKVPQVLCDQVNGLSLLLAREISFRLNWLDTPAHTLNLAHCEQLATEVRTLSEKCSQGLVVRGYLHLAEKTYFHIHPLTHLGSTTEEIIGVNNLVLKALEMAGHRDALKSLRHNLNKHVNAHQNKLLRRKTALQTDIEASRERDHFQRFGQLLYANLASYRLEGNFAFVTDYYSTSLDEVAVPIASRLSLVENAKQYFKRFNRALGTEKHSLERLAQCLQELEYVDTLLCAILLAEDMQTLKEIEGELEELGLITGKRNKTKQPAKAGGPLKFDTLDGRTILVGRNNLQNDALVKNAQSRDLWFHVQKAPGSHVILPYSAQNTEELLIYVASLAAYYSSQRLSANVPVDYTERRFVRRPAGARPGYVLYENQRTIVIRSPEPPTPLKPS